MSDFSPPGFPSSGRPGDTPPPLSREEVALKVVSFGVDLGNTRRPVRLEGEIAEISRDRRTAIIKTAQGQVEVQMRGRETIQPGQAVEIDIPAGNPPRQIILRPAPEPSNAPPPGSHEQAGNARHNNTPSPADRSAERSGKTTTAQTTTITKPTPPPESPPHGPAPRPSTATQANTTQTPTPPLPVTRPTPPVASHIPPEVQAVLDSLRSTAPSPTVPLPQLPAPLPVDAIVRLVRLAQLPKADDLLPLPVPLASSLPPQLSTSVIPADSLPSSAGQAATISIPSASGQKTSPSQTRHSTQDALLSTRAASSQPNPATIAGQFPDIAQTPGLPTFFQTAPAALGMVVENVTPTTLTDYMAMLTTTAQSTMPGGTLSHAFLPMDVGMPPPSTIQAPSAGAMRPADRTIDMRVISIVENPDAIQPSQKTAIENNSHQAASGTNPATTIKASVIATTTRHLPVLSMQWPGQMMAEHFLMQFPAGNLPVGAQLELAPQISSMAASALPSGMAGIPAQSAIMPSSPMGLMGGWAWPVFDDLMSALNPAAAHYHTAAAQGPILPNAAAPQSIPPAILFFMAAVGAGDVAGWLGERNLNTLRRDAIRGADIIGRMTRDFAGLSRMADDPVAQDWRGMAIPMMYQNEISKIHLFYRHIDPDEKDTAGDGGRATRFLFDIHLDRVGDIQLDGYMKTGRLDVILRSTAPFSPTMQAEMRRLYLGALEHGQLTGDLGFQTHPSQWVKVDVRQAALQQSI